MSRVHGNYQRRRVLISLSARSSRRSKLPATTPCDATCRPLRRTIIPDTVTESTRPNVRYGC
jgi:hypothetical protein